MPWQSVPDALEEMPRLPTPAKNYMYIRHFSAPLVDSVLGVCYIRGGSCTFFKSLL